MQHQDFSVVQIGKPHNARLTGPKTIVPHYVDQRSPYSPFISRTISY